MPTADEPLLAAATVAASNPLLTKTHSAAAGVAAAAKPTDWIGKAAVLERCQMAIPRMPGQMCIRFRWGDRACFVPVDPWSDSGIEILKS